MKAVLGKWAKNNKRKIDIEIENHDTYSCDHTLAYIILPCLLQIKQTKQGVPSEFGNITGASHDPQLCFDFAIETYDEAFDESCRKWEEILDKMIWSFQQIIDDSDIHGLYQHGQADYSWEETDETIINPLTNKQEKLIAMIDKNPEDHWFDMEGYELHQNRIQEGLELFGKYYQHLWD